jgi:hypothetical protein
MGKLAVERAWCSNEVAYLASKCDSRIDDCLGFMPIRHYQSDFYGPLFAVSDEGSAAQAILNAAYASAKAKALGALDPSKVGVILDGERMTSAGEVPIGPDEYYALNTVAAGKLLCTTNVGVRANVRLLQSLPEFAVPDSGTPSQEWFEAIYRVFEPFIHTPDFKPRPLTIRLALKPGASGQNLRSIVEALEAARQAGKLGPAQLHRLSLLVAFDQEITSDEQIAQIRAVIDLAADVGIKELALDAELRQTARLHFGVQSLLNIISIPQLRPLLSRASGKQVRLIYHYQLDVESAARTIWTGLHTAMCNGFSAGKYGLVPMMFEEQQQAIELLSRWNRGWTAIPAFYVDTPLVTESDVYDDTRVVEAAILWLGMVRSAGAKVVLFDCPDRVTPRKLLRSDASPGDTGVLTLADVERILEYARMIDIAILWSGGVTSRQAFELAKRRVHGIFSTSSTARKIPVSHAFEHDPRLAAESKPTEAGVHRIHSIVQAGFLSTKLVATDPALAETLHSLAERLLQSESNATAAVEVLTKLDEALVQAWKLQFSPAAEAQSESVSGPLPQPVPANAVRVFRGKRRSGLTDESFLSKLGKVFMPMTVQMQRVYGLAAYLPAVLPIGHAPTLPDEVALVFYETQGAYGYAKECVGGRAYSELHELVFDMTASPSSFPQLFSGSLEFDMPYHLFQTAIDWQVGAAHIYVGARNSAFDLEEFRTAVTRAVSDLQRTPGQVDAAVVCLNPNWVIGWIHGPRHLPAITQFEQISTSVLAVPARSPAAAYDLKRPFAGFELAAKGNFLNMQFRRDL